MRHFLRDTAIALATLAAFGVARPASAHFNLLNPPPADAEPLTPATGGGKGPPPCGSPTTSGVVTPVTGGSMLNIHVQETVLHSGHYRFALAASPETLPADPAVQTTTNGNSIDFQGDPNAAPPVVMDGVWEHTSGTTPIDFNQDVRVPNINCDNCTLQVIEFMADHLYNGQPPANGNPATGGGYYYHHCAALKITADTTQALDTWPTVDGAGAGQTASGGAGGAPSESGGASGAAAGGSAQTGAAGSTTMTVSASGKAGAAATSTATGAGGSATVGATTGGSAGSAASASAGAGTDSDGKDDGGGCNLGTRGTGSAAAFGALLALGLGLGARRRR